MLTLGICFIFSITLLWLFTMYGVWKKNNPEKLEISLSKYSFEIYKKSFRIFRRAYLFTLRKMNKLKNFLFEILSKWFFKIFPKAEKAFEKKDELTGLEHGPSSYFLKTISEEVTQKPIHKKDRRNQKNV